MKSRLSEDSVEPMTIVNPPPVQEMKDGLDSASTSANGSDQVKIEMQAL